jgi:hypothetical protein
MRFWSSLVLAVALSASAAAQTAGPYDRLVEEAGAAYGAGRHAASDSLYALAFEAGTPTASDLYNAACSAALAGHVDRAFGLLERAVVEGWESVGHARTDGDLAPLRQDSVRWAALEASVSASMQGRYGAAFDPDLRAALADVYVTDQGGRRAMADIQRRYEGAARDSAVAALWARQSAVDSVNVVYLEGVIAERGWPGYRLVGRDGAQTAFLVLQHAPLEVQQRHLPALEAAVAAGDADPANLAYLVDRIRVRTGRPQLYGSQAAQDPATGALGFSPIEDEANVDARRAAVGLGPLSEYARQMGFEYTPPAATPPTE